MNTKNIDNADEIIEENDIAENEMIEENDIAENEIVKIIDINEHHHKLKAHKIGDTCLTIATVILCAISLFFDAHFAPFIILLMSSRIGKSIYIITKTNSKKEIGKLVIWIALFSKSLLSCYQLLMEAV